MATRTYDFEDYERWADTVENDGDEIAESFTTARN